jgi:uncharacterized DUF497 family protein
MKFEWDEIKATANLKKHKIHSMRRKQFLPIRYF